MNLKTVSDLSKPSCFMCRFAGRHIVTWPQTIEVMPEATNKTISRTGFTEYTNGTWNSYINVHEQVLYQDGKSMRSGFRQVQLCGEHFFDEYWYWVGIAADEVHLDYIFNQWIERTE